MASKRWLGAAMIVALVLGAAASATSGTAQSPKRRVFVYAEDLFHKEALKAIVGNQGLRHEYRSPGNELIFSAELTRGQIVAVERLGGRIEPVPQIYPMRHRQRHGLLHQRVTPQAKPDKCGDGKCQGNESETTCPKDCGGPPTESSSDRECEPQDQREYHTLLLSGEFGDGTVPDNEEKIRLLVLDTGVNKDHLDLDVTFCYNATGRRIRNNCVDSSGHGTHNAGSAAAYGGEDGLGMFGTAPGVMLGVAKICRSLCFTDDLIRAIEHGTQNWNPHVMTLSFGGPKITALAHAIDAAVSAGTLFFASAGNEGPGADTISFPAAYVNVVAVGLLDAARIASRMSSRGIDNTDDTNDDLITERELELTGGGFVIESTSFDGCYEIMSGSSMSTPSVAGFAAANWQSNADLTTQQQEADATRAYLHLIAEDIDNSGIFWSISPGYDDTAAGLDTSTGYGLPRSLFGTNGGIIPDPIVTTGQPWVDPGQTLDIKVSGPNNSNFRIGVTSPSGDWTFGQFTTDDGGRSKLTLDLEAWTDLGTWLLTVDFGGGTTADFGASFVTFEQTN